MNELSWDTSTHGTLPWGGHMLGHHEQVGWDSGILRPSNPGVLMFLAGSSREDCQQIAGLQDWLRQVSKGGAKGKVQSLGQEVRGRRQ